MRCLDEVTLDGAVESVPHARRLARALLEYNEDIRADVELVIAELVANACLHGAPPVTVRLLDDGTCVRVEVEDRGRAMPVRPRHNTQAMTGRGFALIAALSAAWGVDPVDGGGKTIWAEVRADGSAGSNQANDDADVDIEAMLAAWSDDETTSGMRDGEPIYTVQLGAVPTGLLLEAKSHIDDVVRELTLLRVRADGDELPEAMRALIQAVTQDFAPARESIKRQALEAAARSDVVTELTLRLPPSAADAGERYLAALDQIDRESRAARMLTLAPPPSHRAFRRWYLTALIRQLRAVARGDTSPVTPPFSQVLAEEVDQLAALLATQTRLRLLQTLTRRLAETASVQQMADICVDIAAEYDGVESARVYRLGSDNTLTSIAWRGGPEGSSLYSEVRVDDDVPGAHVVRTGEPLHVKTLSELFARFPRLGIDNLYPSERSLHNMPLRVTGHVTGLLSLTFRAGEIPDDDQVEFVTAMANALAQAMERAVATEQLERERSGELRLLAAQAASLADVVSGRPLTEVLDDLLLAVQAADDDGRLASVLLADGDGLHLRHCAAPGLPPTYNAAIDGIAIGPAVGSCGTAAYRKERVIVEDVMTDPLWADFRALAQDAGIRACWSTPIMSTADVLLGTFALYYREPRTPTADEIAFVDILVGTVALIIERSRRDSGDQLLLTSEAAQRLALEVTVTAGGVGTFDLNLESGELLWDRNMFDIFGVPVGDRRRDWDMNSFYARVHPGDRDRVGELVGHAIEEIDDYEAEYRVVLPDGGTRWVYARGRALAAGGDHAVRLVGAAHDTTARRETEARIARVMDSLSTAFFFLDGDWRFTFVNSEAERVLGRRRSELLGQEIWTEFPAAVGSEFEVNYRQALADGEPVAFEAYYPEPLNAWYEVRGWPNPDGLAVYFIDVTDRKNAESGALRAINRAGLLARVTEELSRSVETHAALQSLAELVVPELGEWCVVTLVDDARPAGSRRGLGGSFGWHSNPALIERVQRYADIRLGLMTDDGLIVQAVETAQPRILNGDALRDLAPMFGTDSEALTTLRELDTESVAVLPLVGQEHPVGMLSVVNSRRRGRFTDEDVDLMREVAARAGLILDRARLYRQQRKVAEGLQRSLLHTPEVGGDLELAVRYVAAAETAQVGGDWYDAFRLSNGSTAVIIGDVMGHDVLAAAAMGEARTLVRTLAAGHDGEPGRTLDDAERIMAQLQLGTLATVLVGRLDPAPNGGMSFTFANAGHPPPLVIGADGEVTLLEGEVSPLLGVGGDHHSEQQISLAAGATLVLYTDGLVERRGQSIDDGTGRLITALRTAVTSDPDRLCDELLEKLLPERPEDDVALLLVRILAR